MYSGSKTGLHDRSSGAMVTPKRHVESNAYNHSGSGGLYNHTMGETALKAILLNSAGILTVLLGIFKNLDNGISVIIGISSIMFIAYKILVERENWLIKRSERREKEYDFVEKKNSKK